MMITCHMLVASFPFRIIVIHKSVADSNIAHLLKNKGEVVGILSGISSM